MYNNQKQNDLIQNTVPKTGRLRRHSGGLFSRSRFLFCYFPSGTAPCRCFFHRRRFCSGFGSFFLIFLFRQSSHLIYFHILQIKIFQYIILSQNSFARKYTLASAKTKVSCFFHYFDCKESATTVPRISAKPIRSMPWNFACKKRRETITAVIGSIIPSRLPMKGPTMLTPFR